MDDERKQSIIEAIINGKTVDTEKTAFSLLGRQEKIATLESIKGVKTESAGKFLNAVLKNEQDKEIKKLIKKLLFRLKTLGISVEESPVEGASVLKRVEQELSHKGYLSNCDGQGVRLVVAGKEMKKNLFAYFHGTVHHTRGLLNLMSTPVKRNDFRNIIDDFHRATQKPFIIVEVSFRYAAFLLEEGSQKSGKFTEEIKALRQFTRNTKSDVEKPEDIYLLPIETNITGVALEDVLTHEIFSQFFVPWDSYEEDRKSFEIAGTSSIVLPPYMIEEQKDSFLQSLLDRKEFIAFLPVMKRVLEDHAYLFYQLKEFSCYKGLIEALAEPDTSRRALAFFVKSLLEKNEQTEPQGLIVNPYGQIRR